MMKSLCAWCGVELPSVAADNLPEDAVTHGICEDCGNRFMGKLGTPLQGFLDGLGKPIGVIDSAGRVVWAGKQMCKLVGKEPEEIQGQLGGDVFECVHAREPGGCGRTVHCSGCAIRRSVTRTFTSGECCVRVPATLKALRAGEIPEIEMYITTQKVSEMVLLQIDSISTVTIHRDAQESADTLATDLL